MADQSLHYQLVDVFAREPFAGNQLAVVLGAHDLSTAQLQAVACEFNLSETAFPVARTPADLASAADYRVRIFTASREIAFAGHPTLGTAWVLANRGDIGTGERLQACGAGLIGVTLPDDPTGVVELRATPRDLSPALPKEAVASIAESVGLTADDVVGRVFAAGCGLTWVHLPVSMSAIPRARPRQREMDDVDLSGSVLQDLLIGINVFASDGLSIRSRVFVPGPSVPEDPATGSAAVGLGMALVAAGLAAPDGATRYEITQGIELGRPSYLSGRVDARDGRAVTCWAAGQVQPIGEGTIAVPPRLTG